MEDVNGPFALKTRLQAAFAGYEVQPAQTASNRQLRKVRHWRCTWVQLIAGDQRRQPQGPQVYVDMVVPERVRL